MGLKYTIHGFQQTKLMEFGLTNDDALILSVIKEMYSSASTDQKIINGNRYIWMNYTYLIKEVIPILYPKQNINGKENKSYKSNLMKKIKKFEDLRLIKRNMQFEKFNKKINKLEKGKFAFLAPTKLLDLLSEYSDEDKKKEKTLYLLKKINTNSNRKKYTLSQKKIRVISKKDKGLSLKKITKILSYKDTLIKDNNNNSECQNVENSQNNIKEKDVVVVSNNFNHEVTDKNIKELQIKWVDILKVHLKPGFKESSLKVKYSTMKELIETYGIKKIEYYLSKHNSFSYKKSPTGLMLNAIKNNYPIIETKEIKYKNNRNKPEQATNYEQREYDDEFFESLYDNF